MNMNMHISTNVNISEYKRNNISLTEKSIKNLKNIHILYVFRTPNITISETRSHSRPRYNFTLNIIKRPLIRFQLLIFHHSDHRKKKHPPTSRESPTLGAPEAQPPETRGESAGAEGGERGANSPTMINDSCVSKAEITPRGRRRTIKVHFLVREQLNDVLPLQFYHCYVDPSAGSFRVDARLRRGFFRRISGVRGCDRVAVVFVGCGVRMSKFGRCEKNE